MDGLATCCRFTGRHRALTQESANAKGKACKQVQRRHRQYINILAGLTATERSETRFCGFFWSPSPNTRRALGPSHPSSGRWGPLGGRWWVGKLKEPSRENRNRPQHGERWHSSCVLKSGSPANLRPAPRHSTRRFRLIPACTSTLKSPEPKALCIASNSCKIYNLVVRRGLLKT